MKAFWFIATNYKRVLAKRKLIQERSRVDVDYMASWFSFKPVSKPAPKKFAPVPARSKTARR